MNLASSSGRKTTTAGLLTLMFFAALSVATSKPKSDNAGDGGTTATATSAGGDPSKTATLVGSCDRSDTFNLDCTESFSPSKADEEKKQCDSLGGKFHLGPCPRINAITQCFEGNPPYLSGSYAYEGRKTKTDPDNCKRGYRDYKKDPDLKPSTSPASCNALATAGSCSQYSAVTADNERSCLNDGAKLVQPPEPCPSANGLAALKLELKDGTTVTEYFYTTEYKDLTGTHTWKPDDVAIICGLAGSKCTKVPFSTGAAASASASAKPTGATTGAATASAKPTGTPTASATTTASAKPKKK